MLSFGEIVEQYQEFTIIVLLVYYYISILHN
nr:MAG TPA: hypothetical protein [Caudoviricetes sp.]